MNKKEEKTYLAIHKALEDLMLERPYSEISVSDIVNRSKVARSTFYAHYKSKDDVLVGLINHIFEHVFSSSLDKEEGHDFSSSPAFDYEHIVMHTFCHFGEDRNLLRAIFLSSASHLFTESLQKVSKPLIDAVYALSPFFMADIPSDIAKSILLGCFVDLLKTFVVEDRNESAEDMANYFFKFRFNKI